MLHKWFLASVAPEQPLSLLEQMIRVAVKGYVEEAGGPLPGLSLYVLRSIASEELIVRNNVKLAAG